MMPLAMHLCSYISCVLCGMQFVMTTTQQPGQPGSNMLQPVSIAGASCYKYLLHERMLYMQRNPDWRRARDRLADAAWHQAAAKMVERTGRKRAPHIEITIDRDWLLLLDEACLRRARFSDGVFSIAVNSVGEMESMMGDMTEEGELPCWLDLTCLVPRCHLPGYHHYNALCLVCMYSNHASCRVVLRTS